MNRGTDYDWAHTTDLPERNFVCGFCGGDITAKTGFTGSLRSATRGMARQDIYICHKCGRPNFRDIEGTQYPSYKGGTKKFSETIVSVSSRFVEIYRQAENAEADALNEIAGPGYGKALEFLIKDYLIKLHPEKEGSIKKMKLAVCIDTLVDNPKIKALSHKARLIRNDETHYERKDENSDMKDLKNLINATVAWIELEFFTAESTSTA